MKAVVKAGTVIVVVAEAEVMRQLQAELIRDAGTVARMVDRFAGVVAARASMSRFLGDGFGVQVG